MLFWERAPSGKGLPVTAPHNGNRESLSVKYNFLPEKNIFVEISGKLWYDEAKERGGEKDGYLL